MIVHYGTPKQSKITDAVEADLPEETTILKLKPNTKICGHQLAVCRMIQLCSLRRGLPGEVRDLPERRLQVE